MRAKKGDWVSFYRDARIVNLRVADPCPFCGATNEQFRLDGDRAAQWVHCWKCGARGPTVNGFGGASAVGRWNLRMAPR